MSVSERWTITLCPDCRESKTAHAGIYCPHELFDEASYEEIEVVPAEQLRGAVRLLATIGQFANTNESLDETAMVRVPLRLLRAARSAGGEQ